MFPRKNALKGMAGWLPLWDFVTLASSFCPCCLQALQSNIMRFFFEMGEGDCLPACPPACLSVCLSLLICLSEHLFVYLFIYLSVCLSVFVCLPVLVSLHYVLLCLCLSLCITFFFACASLSALRSSLPVLLSLHYVLLMFLSSLVHKRSNCIGNIASIHCMSWWYTLIYAWYTVSCSSITRTQTLFLVAAPLRLHSWRFFELVSFRLHLHLHSQMFLN